MGSGGDKERGRQGARKPDVNATRIRFPALKHRPTELFIYHTLIRPSLWNTFHRVALRDLSGDVGHGLPTILYCNHVSWWDGYMAILLERYWRGEFYLMMEEAQLERYRFFQQCGCFSVDRQDARAALRSVQYAATLLRAKPQRALWIFPQGVITPNDHRPLATYNGTAHIAKRIGQVRGIPIALRFEFGAEQRPEALMRLGPAHIIEGPNVHATQANLDARLTCEVNALHTDVINGTTATYSTLLQGRQGINVLWDKLRGRRMKTENGDKQHINP